MVRGKYLNLEEARKLGKLDQFAKDHPSNGDGFVRAETIRQVVALIGHPEVNVQSCPKTTCRGW